MKYINIAQFFMLILILSITILAGDEIAVTAKIIGTVTYSYNQAEGWQSLGAGTLIFDNATIRTGDDGFATLIYLDDKSRITMRPRSELLIQGNHEQNEINKKIKVNFGENIFDIAKGKRGFKVETPTSVASVKGTKFLVVVPEDGNSSVVYGFSGSVAVAGTTGKKESDTISVLVKRKTKAIVKQGKAAKLDSISDTEFINLEKLLEGSENGDTLLFIGHEISVKATEGGTAFPSKKMYAADNIPFQIRATSQPGFTFIEWRILKGTAFIANPFDSTTEVFLNGSDATIEAHFSNNSCKASFSTSEGGDISFTGTRNVKKGIPITVEATAHEGYLFDRWEGSGSVQIASREVPTTEVTFSDSGSVKAHFRKIPVTLSLQGEGSLNPPSFTGMYGDTLTVSAKAESGYTFTHWEQLSGRVQLGSEFSPSTKATLYSDVTLAANYSSKSMTIPIKITTGGTTNLPDTLYLDSATTITVKANAEEYYTFHSWKTTGDLHIKNKKSSETELICNGEGTIEAIFTPIELDLHISKSGQGVISPDGKERVKAGTPITLTAEGKKGYHFSSWRVTDGDATLSSNRDSTTEITLHKTNAFVTGSFVKEIPKITVTPVSTKGGTISLHESKDLTPYEALTLTATPDASYQFSSWKFSPSNAIFTISDATQAEAVLTVIEGDLNISASFALQSDTSLWDLDTTQLALTVLGDSHCTVKTPKKSTHTKGESALLEAEAHYGYSFHSWEVVSGNAIVEEPTNPMTQVTILSSSTIRATTKKIKKMEVLLRNVDGISKKIIINYTDNQ